MGKAFTRKILPALMALILIAGMLPASAAAEDTVTYTKVTEAPDDWSGRYIIVYEEGSLAFDGSLATLDAVDDYKEVTVSGDSVTIGRDDDTFYFEIEKNGSGGYYIRSASGHYIYQSTDGNGMKTSDLPAGSNDISLDSSGNAVIVSSGAHLRFNARSDQMRFRFYRSSGYTNQKAVALYRAESSAIDAPVYAGAVEASVPGGLVAPGTKVELTCASDGAVIRYKIGDGDAQEYSSALTVREDCIIEAWAEGGEYLEGPHTAYRFTVADKEYVRAAGLEEALSAASFVIYHPA